MEKNNILKIVGISLAVICCLGIFSQIVERNMDKEGIKSFVTTNLDDSDDGDDFIDFTDDSDESFLEFIGI